MVREAALFRASDETVVYAGGEASNVAIWNTLGMSKILLVNYFPPSFSNVSYDAGRGKRNKQDEPYVPSTM
jgi:hypothetical protein